MSFYEFALWAIALVILGVPALFFLAIVVMAWVDARAASQAWSQASSPAVGTISQYGPATEEPEEEEIIEAQTTLVEEPAQNLQPENGNGKKRPTAVELEEMRTAMVDELYADGLDLAEIEKAVGAYANKWTVKDIEKIRGIIVPNLKAELAGA